MKENKKDLKKTLAVLRCAVFLASGFGQKKWWKQNKSVPETEQTV